MLKLILSMLDDPAFRESVAHEIQKYPEESFILKEGAIYSKIYIIRSGRVRVTVNGLLYGENFVHPGINELGPEDVFGEFGLIDGEPASADILALCETELLVLDSVSLSKYLDNHPEKGYQFSKALLKILVNRLRKANKSILHLYIYGLKIHEIDKYIE